MLAREFTGDIRGWAGPFTATTRPVFPPCATPTICWMPFPSCSTGEPRSSPSCSSSRARSGKHPHRTRQDHLWQRDPPSHGLQRQGGAYAGRPEHQKLSWNFGGFHHPRGSASLGKQLTLWVKEADREDCWQRCKAAFRFRLGRPGVQLVFRVVTHVCSIQSERQVTTCRRHLIDYDIFWRTSAFE